MDTHKLLYLQSFIHHSKGNADLNSYLEIIKKKERQIHESYAEDIHMSSDEFIRMVLIDSIFIIELLRSRRFILPLINYMEVRHDLKFTENQLPYFILKDLYSAAFKPNDKNSTSTMSFTHFACDWLEVDKSRVEVDPITNEATGCCHLLDLLRSHHLPSHQITDTTEEVHSSRLVDIIDDSHIVCPTAMCLYEAGVKFRVSDKPSRLLDIHFDEDKGILTIPKFIVGDDTETLFRNMTAFEHCHYYPGHTYIADYHFCMDCLINTWEDVHLLAKAYIIHNWLGSEKEVACLVNSLGTNITTSSSRYYYASKTEHLNDHCNKRWNRYKATLKHTYFKHPWAVLSVIYAVILLLITIAQLLTGILAAPGVKK